MFSMRLFGREPRHIRHARAFLKEARMGMLEHTLAAEHYLASAGMYAERVRRLEGEIAAWEAQKNGMDVMEPAPTSSLAPSAEPGRLENRKKSTD